MVLRTVLRRSLLVILLGTAAFGAWRMHRAPSDAWAAAEAALDERIEQYVELRERDDWPALYEMTDTRHRKVVGIETFLAIYGRGVLEVLEMRIASKETDPARGRAVVTIETRARLVPEKLPASVRRGFSEEHAEHLERSGTQRLEWIWQDGQWNYLMDREILTRRDSSGNAIEILGE